MFDLIEETQDFVIISKHENIDVHSAQDSLIDQLRAQIHHADLRMCHRLDKMTSGLMIFAKSKSIATIIQTSFEKRKVIRKYVGITDQTIKKKNGTVIGDLIKSRNGNFTLLKSRENPSITKFRSTHHDQNRIILIEPITGKTHQIRVAMKSVGAPLIGDDRYGGSSSDRLFLHAYKLIFNIHGTHFSYVNFPDFSQKIEEDNLKYILENLESKWH